MSSALRHCGRKNRRFDGFSRCSPAHVALLLSCSRTPPPLSPGRCCGAGKRTRSPLFRGKCTAKERNAFQPLGHLSVCPSVRPPPPRAPPRPYRGPDARVGFSQLSPYPLGQSRHRVLGGTVEMLIGARNHAVAPHAGAEETCVSGGTGRGAVFKPSDSDRPLTSVTC